MEKKPKILTVIPNGKKSEILEFSKNQFNKRPDTVFDSNKEMFEYAERSKRQIMIVLLPECESLDFREIEIEKDKGGRPTGSIKEPTVLELKALERELKKLEYRKEKLCRVLNMTLPTFRKFLKAYPEFEEQRAKNQIANRNKPKGTIIQIVGNLPQFTMN